MSLRWRFALLFAAGAVTATFLIAAAAFATTRESLNSQIDSSLVSRRASVSIVPVDDLLRLIKAADEPLVIRGGGLDFFQDRGVTGRLFGPDAIVQWSDADSKKTLIQVEGAPKLPVLLPDDQGRGNRSQRFDTVKVDDDVSYRLLTTKIEPDSLLLVAREITEPEHVLDTLAQRIIWIGLLLTVAAGTGGWLLARRVTRPLESLTEVAAEVARTRKLLEPIDVQASGEVGRLADSFNRMIEALRSSRQRQHQLVQDAGHELRTPLASLRTNIEVLERAPQMKDSERDRLLADVRHELEEMTALVGELVVLAVEQEQPDEPVRSVSLKEVASTAAERASRRSRGTVTVSGQGAAPQVRPRAIERAVDNLVDNALKWGPPDQPVEIILDGGDLRVRDKGPGIPTADLPHIFDRFYRAPEARSAPGSGLGLAIVKEIVEQHGGQVHARNHPEGGAEVGFTLPL